MRAPLTIFVVQTLYLIALLRPLGHPSLHVPAPLRMGFSYLLSMLLVILIAMGLDVAGCFTSPRAFWMWAGLCLVLNIVITSGERTVRQRGRLPGKAIPVLIFTAIALLWIRLADPLLNVALPGTDNYAFLNYYVWLQNQHLAIHDYPSGFAVMTAVAPWPLDAYALARWSPHIVFLFCLAASIGGWARLGGTRFAFTLTGLLGAAWFLYPFTGHHAHFVQWTMIYAVLPLLIYLYAQLIRGTRMEVFWLIGMLANIAFALTAAYFALYLNAILFVLSACLLVVKKRPERKQWISITLLALAAPVALGLYVGILSRLCFPFWPTGVSSQANNVLATTTDQPWQGAADQGFMQHPLVMVSRVFLFPHARQGYQPRWLLLGLLFVGGCVLWYLSPTQRKTGPRLLAGVLLISLISAFTGMLELPAWEGRNIFVALFSGCAVLLCAAQRLCPRCYRHVFRSPSCFYGMLLITAGPAALWPPMIGRTIPIADIVQPRSVPADNRVVRHLLAEPGAHQARLVCAVVRPTGEGAGLPANLARLKRLARESVFAGYSLLLVDDLETALVQDAMLIPVGRLEAHALPPGVQLHTQGPGYVFALRESIAGESP